MKGRFGWFPTTRKKPPPAHGIKIDKSGTTWWGKRWIAALEHVLAGSAGRLARGRTYARAGRTHDLVVRRGTVTAKVTGSRPRPYDVAIELAELGEAQWKKAIAAMAKEALFAAELLAGRMPDRIDEAFRAAGASLFPERRADLVTRCSCPDWGDPCKHVAATHYVLGEALDRDPFLLFELRGRTRDEVLGALRAARGADPARVAPEIPKVRLDAITAAAYDRPRADVPVLGFSFEPSEGGVLCQLGVPPGWKGAAPPADALSPIVRRAAEVARRIALADPEVEEPKKTRPARKRRTP